jgi:hypothetical protein
MIRRSRLTLFVLATTPVFTFIGCQQILRIPVEIPLNGGGGTFDVVAGGQPVQTVGGGTLPAAAANVGSGTMRIKSENVSFTPAGPAKGLVNFQIGSTITVMASIAGAEAVNTVCANPVDTYGPYTITLDADSNITSITPGEITLQSSTIDILNTGSFSFCLTAESETLSGTLTIDALSFNVGL